MVQLTVVQISRKAFTHIFRFLLLRLSLLPQHHAYSHSFHLITLYSFFQEGLLRWTYPLLLSGWGERVWHRGFGMCWPLDEIDPKNSKFPCCLVWCPLPVVSWLTPFFGHVGICREDGGVLDFSGSYLINVDDFAFGAVARYYQLDRTKCCFPPHLAGHTCNCRYQHADYGPAITWDDALYSSQCHFEHHTYNIFTCNCYSFVANCLNRLCYGGSMEWNMVSVAALVLIKGHWVDGFSVLRSFLPCITVLCLGLAMTGWHFLIALLSFSFLVFGWFLFGTYCAKNLLKW